MRLKLNVNHNECKSLPEQDLPPVDLTRVATGMLGGLSVHRWLAGITYGLGLPQPPHIARTSLSLHERNTPPNSLGRNERLDLA